MTYFLIVTQTSKGKIALFILITLFTLSQIPGFLHAQANADSSVFTKKMSVNDSLIASIDKASSETDKIDLFNEIAWNLRATNRDSAIYYANLALETNSKGNYIKGQIKSYNTLGTLVFYNSDYKKSISYFLQAYKLSDEAKDTVNLAKIANNIGTIYQMLGKYDESVEFNIRSLVFKERNHDTVGIINSLINISSLYYQLNKFDEGIEHSLRALDLAKHSDSSKQAIILNTIGALYTEVGDFNASVEYLEKALEINIRHGNKKKEAINYQNLATNYAENEDFEKAMYFYNKSLEINVEQGDEKGIAKTKMCIGITAFEQKEYEHAITDLADAKLYYEQFNQMFELRSIYEHLAKSHAAMHVYDEAYKHLFLSYDASDSLYSIESKKIIEELEEKYEADKRELQIQNQAVLIEKKNASIKFYFILAFLLGIGGSLVLWLVFTKRKVFRKLIEKNYLIATMDEKERLSVTNASHPQKRIYRRLISSLEEGKVYTDVDLTIDKLAKAIKTNRTNLSEVIHLFTGNSYPAFVNEYRINHAIKLLIEDGQKFSIDAIAADSGFKSVSNFYKLFKESTGITPAAFQKRKRA